MPPADRRILAAIVLGGIAMLTIAYFQVSQRILLARGVPNEARSLFVAGLEVHHLTWGILLVAAAALHGPRLWCRGAGHWSMLAVTGFGLGLVFDEWFYCTLRTPTDEAYFHLSTLVSAVAVSILFPILWLLVPRHAAHG